MRVEKSLILGGGGGGEGEPPPEFEAMRGRNK